MVQISIVRLSDLLAKQEAIIKRGEQTFLAVGEALTTIRDHRLYKTAGFKTFDLYCRERWGWSKVRSIQLIGAAKAVTTVTNPPANERQARELARVPESKRENVWRETNRRAKAAKKNVTAGLIKEVADDLGAVQRKPKKLDRSRINLSQLVERVAAEGGRVRERLTDPYKQILEHRADLTTLDLEDIAAEADEFGELARLIRSIADATTKEDN
jgi:hypothetical protein